ncbi:MAG: class I SAM-dependent methyltransferase [Methanoregula sp.]|jgi:SAM-dependent methyltransferase
MTGTAQTHYDVFPAGSYAWISGGLDVQVRKNKKFFSSHSIMPRDNRVAIDLGAGCGFQSIALAQIGYSVTAVDFCQSLLDELRSHTGSLPVETIRSDIRHYPSWSGRHPELIVCMGDTLTHLPGITEVQDLVRQCFSELDPGGRLVLSLRDYSREPDGAVVVIPVLRQAGRIFLCRLEYHADTITVQDILYSCRQGAWERIAGKYPKIRIAPGTLSRMLTGAGFVIEHSAVKDGMITVIARRNV